VAVFLGYARWRAWYAQRRAARPVYEVVEGRRRARAAGDLDARLVAGLSRMNEGMTPAQAARAFQVVRGEPMLPRRTQAAIARLAELNVREVDPGNQIGGPLTEDERKEQATLRARLTAAGLVEPAAPGEQLVQVHRAAIVAYLRRRAAAELEMGAAALKRQDRESPGADDTSCAAHDYASEMLAAAASDIERGL
jgi:hypothetical protein